MQVLNDSVENDDGDEIGSYDAYVVKTSEENWRNYLRTEISDSEKADFLIKRIEEVSAEKHFSVAILKSLNVDEDFRGMGYGSQLMEKFIDEASDYSATLFFLAADKNESQAKGFSLEEFYRGYDFETIIAQDDTDIMVFDVKNRLDLDGKDIKKLLDEKFVTKSSSRLKM